MVKNVFTKISYMQYWIRRHCLFQDQQNRTTNLTTIIELYSPHTEIHYSFSLFRKRPCHSED
jgi:hypothetical protein